MIIIISRLVLLLALFFSLPTNTDHTVFAKGTYNNVREACNVTTYQKLCIHTLARFSDTAGRSPSKWARVAVSVTIQEVKNVRAYLKKLKSNRNMKETNRGAISDCIETFGDALDELHRSIGVLRSLSKNTFRTQMGELNNWISAALTDEDTCLEGFQGNFDGETKFLQIRVQNVSHITSNALAIVTKLATVGLGSISEP